MTCLVRKRSGYGVFTVEEDYYSYTIDPNDQLLQLDNLNTKFNIRFSKEHIKMEKGQA